MGFNMEKYGFDILSRFGWARPLKTKQGPEVAKAMEDIFQTSKRIPTRIQSDLGKEFYNASVKRLLEKYNVELFSVRSPVKPQWLKGGIELSNQNYGSILQV